MTKQEFWSYFEHHRPGLEEFISGKSKDYAAYNALSADLHAFNENLIPEITMDTENRYILVISCDGFQQGIHAVEELTYQNATILHLDHTIGEYDAMTRIRNVQFRRLKLFQSKDGLKTLDDLKAELDAN